MISIIDLYSSLVKNVGAYALMSWLVQDDRNEESTEGNMEWPETMARDWSNCLLFIMVEMIDKNIILGLNYKTKKFHAMAQRFKTQRLLNY
jgi:hypothetical protein